MVVFRRPPLAKQKLKTPLILLLATLATITADGLLRTYGYSDPITKSLSLSQAFVVAALYGISLMAIIGVHELGHKIASWYHKTDSSWPYFIPGIPGILPTMGAMIRAFDPPMNRDSLFDLGLSGPIAGLVVTLIVSVIAVSSANIVPLGAFSSSAQQSFVNPDYYTSFLISLLKNSSPKDVVVGPVFSLLYFAYSLGFLITFLNLLPAWQLDGGHISNSALSPRVHQILTYVSIIIMFLTQFYFMAILILLFSSRVPSLRPLDDVSPLSKMRKLCFILTWVLAAGMYLFVVYNNAFFGFGPIIH